MKPYEHTNGDVLRGNPELCRRAAEVFEYIVMGLYDYRDDAELAAQQAFWLERLEGTRVRFSLGGEVFPRTLTPHDDRMFRPKQTFPNAPCIRPAVRLIIHYDGEMANVLRGHAGPLRTGQCVRNADRAALVRRQACGDHEGARAGAARAVPLCAGCPIPPPEPVDWATRMRREARRAVDLVRQSVG